MTTTTSTAPHDEVAGPPEPEEGRRPTLRRLVYLVGVAWLLVAPFYVTAAGTIEFSPGFATSTTPLVDLDVDGELNGEFDLLAVHLSEPTLAEWVRARFDPARDLRPRDEVIPQGTSNRDFFTDQRADFASNFEIAAAVGLEAAGFEVEVISSVGIEDVVDDGPADGLLLPGDRIVAVDDRPVTGIDDLVSRLRDGDDEVAPLRAGDELDLTVLRVVEDPDDDAVDADPDTEDVVEEEVGVQVTARPLDLDADEDTAPRPGIGIVGSTFVTGLNLPVDAELDNSRRIGGPSAGLVFALTVYDLVAEEDLLDGREVHATGTITSGGQVGPIGGIRQKVFSADRAGADVLLVPDVQLSEALEVAPDGLAIIGVATFDEALEALRTG